jgi:hypothetical protein
MSLKKLKFSSNELIEICSGLDPNKYGKPTFDRAWNTKKTNSWHIKFLQ